MNQQDHDLLNDSLPLLTETVSEPDLPVLSDMLMQQMQEFADQQADEISQQAIAHTPVTALPDNLEEDLHHAARLIMQEVIDDYMLQIENELHRRLEDHLQQLLRGAR